jgi:hypothetical protein
MPLESPAPVSCRFAYLVAHARSLDENGPAGGTRQSQRKTQGAAPRTELTPDSQTRTRNERLSTVPIQLQVTGQGRAPKLRRFDRQFSQASPQSDMWRVVSPPRHWPPRTASPCTTPQHSTSRRSQLGLWLVCTGDGSGVRWAASGPTGGACGRRWTPAGSGAGPCSALDLRHQP